MTERDGTVRRSVLTRLAGLLTVACVGGRETARAASPAIPVFRRGIGVSHAFGWADVTSGGDYVSPPFQAARFTFGSVQRQAIKGAGFDFVRLVVDVGPFLAFTGSVRSDAIMRLLDTVQALIDDDLGVIVDLHPSAMNPRYRPQNLTAGVSSPLFQVVTELLSEFAGRLGSLASGRPQARLALELLNEPEIPPANWQPMLEAAYRAARAGSPSLPLIIGGGSMDAPDALDALDMRPFAKDPACLYTYHDYSPWQFTHQGVMGNPAYLFDAVPYPAPENVDVMIRATRARIAALAGADPEGQAATATAALIQYARSGFDRAALGRTFDRVAAWQKAQGLPAHAILLGEFGAHTTPWSKTSEGAAARLRWLRDMRELAEAHGFAWAAWTYIATGGFALATAETGPGFDAATLGALGLSDR